MYRMRATVRSPAQRLRGAVVRRYCTANEPEWAPKKTLTQVTCDIVGLQVSAGSRMPAGALLDRLDLCAALSAQKHAQEALKYHEGSVATVAVDGCDFSIPVFHGDLIKMEGRVVMVGSSSMVVQLTSHRRNMLTRTWELIQRAIFTMVAVTRDLRPLKGIPKLIEGEENIGYQLQHRKKMEEEWKTINEASPESLRLCDVVDERDTRMKSSFYDMADTKLVTKRVFLPRSLNMNNTIFGGDVLMWMEDCASRCAMDFLGHRNVHTIAMNRVEFKRPIFITDWVEQHVQVVYVSEYHVHLEAKVYVDRDGELLHSHSAYFVCLQVEPGSPIMQPITRGIKLREGDSKAIFKYWQAKRRHRFWKTHFQNDRQYIYSRTVHSA